MEFELKDIRERSLTFWVLIAIMIHLAVGYGVYSFFGKPSVGNLQNVIQGKNSTPSVTPPVNSPEDKISTAIAEFDQPDENNQSEENQPVEENEPNGPEFELPPFEDSALNSRNLDESTYVHSSGLLFADTIPIPEELQQPKKQAIVEPIINRNFTLSNLPREFRDREWRMTLRLRVNSNGKPIGRVSVVKSSGDKVLDQLTVTRITESTFIPAHYEDSSTPIDHSYDLEIHYK